LKTVKERTTDIVAGKKWLAKKNKKRSTPLRKYSKITIE